MRARGDLGLLLCGRASRPRRARRLGGGHARGAGLVDAATRRPPPGGAGAAVCRVGSPGRRGPGRREPIGRVRVPDQAVAQPTPEKDVVVLRGNQMAGHHRAHDRVGRVAGHGVASHHRGAASITRRVAVPDHPGKGVAAIGLEATTLAWALALGMSVSATMLTEADPGC